MFYFINEYILGKNSSVEHAAMKRVKLFNNQKTPAKIVTKMYDRLLHQTIGKFGVDNDEVLNMFDYFQGTTEMPTKVMHADDLDLPVEYAVEVGANFSKVFNGDDLVENVGFIPGTIGRVFYREYLDNQGNRLSTDLWDWRGFKSSTQFFGQNGKLAQERYYTPTGETVLEQFFVPDTNGNPLASRIILHDYQGVAERFFQNTDGLFDFFIAELSHRSDEQVTFISDRPGTGVKPLLALTDDAHKYITVPIYHAKDLNDPVHAQLDGFLVPAFDNVAHFDGFVTSTESQAQHLRTRFPDAKVTVIPAVTTKTKSQSKLRPITERPKRLLVVGRLSADRQIDHIIRTVALVKQQVPSVQCDFYGYGADDYVKEMQDLVKELNLGENIHFLDYHPDLEDRYDDYQLLINTDLVDGGPMAMPEAMSHGIPVVSYRFNYGPRDFINEGKDGYIVDPGNQLGLRDHICELLTNAKQLTIFSEAAYNKLHTDQTELKVWHRWQQLLGL